MSNTNATTPLIQPSQNDVNGGVSGDGKKALEKYVRELFKAVNAISYQITGDALPTSAANLVLIVPAGSAYISGYYVTWAATNVTLPASSTSHIFVKLISASGLATNVQIEDNTTGTYPADAIKLGTVVTIGTAITASTDQRLLDGNQRIRRVVISATGLTNWIVPANVTRIRVRMWAGGGGGGGGGDGGGFGVSGYRGGYVEATLTVTPGATIAVTNGAGGAGGAGGSAGGDGTAGSDAAHSTLVGPGFNFSANAGPGGAPGIGSSSGGGNGLWFYHHGTAQAAAGTADVLMHGGGMAPGIGGNAGVAGTAGQNGVTIIEF